jgi:BirA family biotin operon repressor/biotin-[acetyl-CoA-carboxylase] ligase
MNKDLTTLFTGRHSTVLTEVNSTNTYLAEFLRGNTLPEGAVVRALSQIEGRGQAGTSWESESGKNIISSFVFYPSFVAPKDIFLLNKTYSLGVFEFIQRIAGHETSIKWPNDIYWNNKKVAGMLIENSINSSSVLHSILGLGININQESFSSKISNAISLSMIVGKKLELDELFNELCSCIEAWYLRLKNGEIQKINEAYLLSLYSRGIWKTFKVSNNSFTGCIMGVEQSGKLQVMNESYELKQFDLKEIQY